MEVDIMMNVYAKPPKKMLPMLILEILRDSTDAEHTLSQRDIREILKSDYEMDVDRKAVKRNIENLIEMGCGIRCSETIRMTPNPKTGEPEENVMVTDLWLERDFEDSELRLLVDAMMFSNHIPKRQRKDLIEKIASLSNRHFQSHVKHISTTPDTLPQSPQLFMTIEMLDEAITKRRKVRFHYMEYGTDKKLHAKRRDNGEVREYVVSPYQMAANEGKYYLICNYDKYDDISNYRIDRIADIEILGKEVKPFKDLTGAGKAGLDLDAYMEQHIYMYSSPNAHVKFRAVRPMIGDIIDVFGTNVEFVEEGEGWVTVSAKVNELAMHQFAKRFMPDIVVLEPERLVKGIQDDIERAARAYEGK